MNSVPSPFFRASAYADENVPDDFLDEDGFGDDFLTDFKVGAALNFIPPGFFSV